MTEEAKESVTTTDIESKTWYLSKRIWLNVLSIVSVVVAKYTGYQLTSEDTEMILAAIAGLNLVLTLISTKKVTITAPKQ